MSWEHVIPNVGSGSAAQAMEPAMDSDGFAAFYERSAKPLWAYLARASGDPALADDLTQESYVRFLCANAPSDGEVGVAKVPVSHREQPAARSVAASAHPAD